jgi:hypothetical protein
LAGTAQFKWDGRVCKAENSVLLGCGNSTKLPIYFYIIKFSGLGAFITNSTKPKPERILIQFQSDCIPSINVNKEPSKTALQTCTKKKLPIVEHFINYNYKNTAAERIWRMYGDIFDCTYLYTADVPYASKVVCKSVNTSLVPGVWIDRYMGFANFPHTTHTRIYLPF